MRLLPLPVSLRAELSGRLLDGKTIMSTLVTHTEDLQQQSIVSFNHEFSSLQRELSHIF